MDGRLRQRDEGAGLGNGTDFKNLGDASAPALLMMLEPKRDRLALKRVFYSTVSTAPRGRLYH